MDLPFGGQFLLWSARLWQHGHIRGVNCHPLLLDAFECVGAIPAFAAMDDLMTILQVGASRHFDLLCHGYPDISADECHLVHTIALHQSEGDGRSNGIAFDAWLGTAWQIQARDAAATLSASFKQAGVTFPLEHYPRVPVSSQVRRPMRDRQMLAIH